MTSYFSTFTTGFQDVVEEALTTQLDDVHILMLTDGLIIYETESSMEEIKNLKFLNNSFILLRRVEDTNPESLKDMLKILLKDTHLDKATKLFGEKDLTFRVRASVANQFISIDKNILKNIEDKITRVGSLRVDRSLPDIEFHIILRSEGFGLIGIRFTRRENYEKTLKKGELYPELAYILCLISKPKNDDIFLDPFAGHGSIPAQRLHFPYKQIIAGERDEDLQIELEKKFTNRVTVESADGLSLSMFRDNSINKIVTDPPWGIHDTDLDVKDFYMKMLSECCRILITDGVIVILTAQKELLEELLSSFKETLVLEEKYTTLVSGRKAGVYKIKKV